MYTPVAPHLYNGPQYIISSGRIIINASKDSILFFSNKSIGLSSNETVNIDSGKEVIINSPKITLGLKANEPLLLGNKTINLLEELIRDIDLLSKSLTKLVSLPPGTPYADVNLTAGKLSKTCLSTSLSLKTLLSKQNYTV